MKKGLYALAFGTFGFGIAEYTMMGVLPDIADNLNCSITQAGHLISAYALGVCVGAPLIAIKARNWPLRRILLVLMATFIIGSVLTVVSPNYWTALCARFITGLPHGAYFGVGVIVANRLAARGKGTSAVALMVMGMTIANLLGVPLCNLMGHLISWRLIFVLSTLCGVATIILIKRWIPYIDPLPKTNIKGMFAFLKLPTPWLLLLATILANGGVFCWYSYINPLMTTVSGFSANSMPYLMFLAGGSMCIGNFLGGKLSDSHSPSMVAMYTQALIALSLGLIAYFAFNSTLSVLLMCVTAGSLFALSSPQQQLLLEHSPGGEMMGGAMVQLAFNLGNALGAFSGGWVIKEGYGLEYIAAVGAVFALIGTLVLFVLNYFMRSRLNVFSTPTRR